MLNGGAADWVEAGMITSQMLAVALVVLGLGGLSAIAQANEPAGATRVAKWKDDKQCAFLLMYDDSIESHVKHAIPEMQKRGMVGTFYVNPSRPSWKQFEQDWTKTFPAMGMEYGNHTFTHSGFDNFAGADEEFAQCNEVIRACYPDRPWPYLISYGQPGGIKPERWKLTAEEKAELLKKYSLIERPPFGNHGAAISVKTPDQMMGLVEDALKKGNMGYIVFHGVGGDWISVDMPTYVEFLDRLQAKRDQVWVTGHITAHKYEVQQKAAAVEMVKAGEDGIELKLTCTADPKFYDAPLTLVTTVPQGWTVCQITQGTTSTATAAGGTLKYDALPNGDLIRIRPAK